MTQNIQTNSMVHVERVGMTQNGRVVYQIGSQDGKTAGIMTLPAQQCDSFEKAVDDLNKAAPKLEEYMKTQTPESLKRKQKQAKWALILSTLTGSIIPAATTGKLNRWLQWGTTIAGGIVGFVAGKFIGSKIATPPGAKDIARASEIISKLDVQPLQD